MTKEYNLIIRIVVALGLAILIWIVGVMVGQENAVTIIDSGNLFGSVNRIEKPSASIMIDYNNGIVNVFEKQFSGATDVWQFLNNLAVEQNLVIEGQILEDGSIEWQSFDGLVNYNNPRWHVWLNNEYLPYSELTTKLKKNDILLIKYFNYTP